MYGCESWTIKKAEHQRIDVFELWRWRRLLRVPWTARRSNQPIVKRSLLSVHRKDWCWSWNSNTLATWCTELTYLKRLWCWERLKVGGEGDDRGWDGWMVLPTLWRWVWINSGSWWWTARPGVLQSMESRRVGHDWVTELNWTDILSHVSVYLYRYKCLNALFTLAKCYLSWKFSLIIQNVFVTWITVFSLYINREICIFVFEFVHIYYMQS